MADPHGRASKTTPTARADRTANAFMLVSLGGQFRAPSQVEVIEREEAFLMGQRHARDEHLPDDSADTRGFDRDAWESYTRARSGVRPPVAPAFWPIELSLIAVETLITAAGARRPLMSMIVMLPARMSISQLRPRAERHRARQLKLSAANAPRRSFGSSHSESGQLLISALLAIHRRRRKVQIAQADWSLHLAGKVIKEIDRRRSWRLAGGPTRPPASARTPIDMPGT